MYFGINMTENYEFKQHLLFTLTTFFILYGFKEFDLKQNDSHNHYSSFSPFILTSLSVQNACSLESNFSSLHILKTVSVDNQ